MRTTSKRQKSKEPVKTGSAPNNSYKEENSKLSNLLNNEIKYVIKDFGHDNAVDVEDSIRKTESLININGKLDDLKKKELEECIDHYNALEGALEIYQQGDDSDKVRQGLKIVRRRIAQLEEKQANLSAIQGDNVVEAPVELLVQLPQSPAPSVLPTSQPALVVRAENIAPAPVAPSVKSAESPPTVPVPPAPLSESEQAFEFLSRVFSEDKFQLSPDLSACRSLHQHFANINKVIVAGAKQDFKAAFPSAGKIIFDKFNTVLAPTNLGIFPSKIQLPDINNAIDDSALLPDRKASLKKWAKEFVEMKVKYQDVLAHDAVVETNRQVTDRWETAVKQPVKPTEPVVVPKEVTSPTAEKKVARSLESLTLDRLREKIKLGEVFNNERTTRYFLETLFTLTEKKQKGGSFSAEEQEFIKVTVMFLRFDTPNIATAEEKIIINNFQNQFDSSWKQKLSREQQLSEEWHLSQKQNVAQQQGLPGERDLSQNQIDLPQQQDNFSSSVSSEQNFPPTTSKKSKIFFWLGIALTFLSIGGVITLELLHLASVYSTIPLLLGVFAVPFLKGVRDLFKGGSTVGDKIFAIGNILAFFAAGVEVALSMIGLPSQLPLLYASLCVIIPLLSSTFNALKVVFITPKKEDVVVKSRLKVDPDEQQMVISPDLTTSFGSGHENAIEVGRGSVLSNGGEQPALSLDPPRDAAAAGCNQLGNGSSSSNGRGQAGSQPLPSAPPLDSTHQDGNPAAIDSHERNTLELLYKDDVNTNRRHKMSGEETEFYAGDEKKEKKVADRSLEQSAPQADRKEQEEVAVQPEGYRHEIHTGLAHG